MTRPVLVPETMSDCWAMMADHPEASVYAGGTDLLVRLPSLQPGPAALICLERISELRAVSEQEDAVRIGAGVTHQVLTADPLVARFVPVLARAAAAVGGPAVRHMGTIGGNVVTASPAGDTLPALHVCDGEVEVRSGRESRLVPVRDFIVGPGRTVLRPGELVTALVVPKVDRFHIQHFEKVGRRNALAVAVVSLAALIRSGPDGVVEEAHLAWGSVGPTVIREPAVEALLVGAPLSPESLEKAADAARKAVRPMDDVRAGAAYRRQVAGNLLLRLSPGAQGRR